MTGMTVYCSFCGKSQNEAFCLISGPSVLICDECVEMCRDMVGRNRMERPPSPASADRSPEGQDPKGLDRDSDESAVAKPDAQGNKS